MQGTMCEDGDLGDLLCMTRHNQIISVEIEVVGLRPSSMLEAALLTLCVLQGTDLQQRPLAFDQVLKFIRNSRSIGRRLVKFIGISQTGLTTDMVRQITRAIASLPANTVPDCPSPRLEMQKVVARALCFCPPLQH